MTLSITYSHCLADPTWCDSGVSLGKDLVTKLGLKPNEPIAIKSIVPYCNIQELLWCLRVVKPSQKLEADRLAWAFAVACVGAMERTLDPDMVAYLKAREAGLPIPQLTRQDLADKYNAWRQANKPIRYTLACDVCIAMLRDDAPSQMAVNVAVLLQKYKELDGKDKEEEARQRKFLEDRL